ncbi:MAG: transposase-like protein [Parcubacteria group bacterium Greene0714_36]|nr:MAG: transposase-like protein [Parcubacteria group bacterium Greene0714_36]
MKRLRRIIHIIAAFHRSQTALLTSLNLGIPYKAVKRVYDTLRLSIVRQCEREAGKMSGEIELDEAYFGGRRKGKRGRGATGKSIVFGLLERDGRVYTKVVDAVSKEILMDVIRRKSRKGSVYYTDKFKSYNSLKRYGKHYTLNHGKTFVRKGRKRSVHINGIEGFWSFAKHGLYNYRGVSGSMFPLYLKEMEYRYNHRKDNLLNLFIYLYFGGNST